MFFGYNTNGFAHHRLADAATILAEQGYQGIALTVDVHTLDVTQSLQLSEIESVRNLFHSLGLRVVIETGARFLLDPRRKHQPTLISSDEAGQRRRFEFLQRCGELASAIRADAVSFWSGTLTDDTPSHVLMDRLVSWCRRLCETMPHVRWAFEPEPGMLIDTMERYQELAERVDHPAFGLTLDLGHLHCNGELPISAILHRYRDRLWNVHIEDMKRGVHDHLFFGEGDMDFADIFRGLSVIDYQGGVFVELSRHSHNAVEIARRSMQFLQSMVGAPQK